MVVVAVEGWVLTTVVDTLIAMSWRLFSLDLDRRTLDVEAGVAIGVAVVVEAGPLCQYRLANHSHYRSYGLEFLSTPSVQKSPTRAARSWDSLARSLAVFDIFDFSFSCR